MQRILLHWSGIGVNLHRDQPHSEAALCPHCNSPESEEHLLRHCNDPIIMQSRIEATLEAAHYIQHHASQNPIANFMQCLHAARADHPRGLPTATVSI